MMELEMVNMKRVKVRERKSYNKIYKKDDIFDRMNYPEACSS